MQSTIAIILVLGVLIAFHELGHFLLAKLLGVGVRTFSLGFGPKILGFKKGETDYRLSVIPLGGFVQMVGERPGEDPPEGFTPAQSFSQRPAWQRMLIVAAGPVFNFILAWFIFWGVFLAQGVELPLVQEVNDQSPAMQAGLKPGDMITAIDGRRIHTGQELPFAMFKSKGKELTLTVSRQGQTLELPVSPKLTSVPTKDGGQTEIYMIGIAYQSTMVPTTFFRAPVEGLARTWSVIASMGDLVSMLVSGELSLKQNLGGPIMIGQMVHAGAKAGLAPLLMLTALISINLGILNLLPIPVLDGGHLLFYTLETIFRRPINRRVQEITTTAGLFFLISIMLLTVYNDLQRIFAWPSLW